MTLRRLAGGLLCACVACGGVARGAEPAETIKKKRQDLESRAGAIDAQVRQIRTALMAAGDLADAQRAADAARKAYEQKVAASAKVSAARAAADEAAKAARDAATAALAGDKEAADLLKQIEDAKRAVAEARSEERMAETALGEHRRRIAAAGDADLKKLADAVTAAEVAYHNPGAGDPKLAAAVKAAADARAVLAEKVKSLPEKQAVDAAERAYAEALKSSDAAVKARQARDAARKELEAAVAAKLAGEPAAVAQLKRMADAEGKAEAARVAGAAAEAKLQEARSRVGKADPKVAEAKKAAAAAQQAVSAATAADAAAERDAMDAAQKSLREKVEAKLAADPKAVELRKQMDDLRKQIDELRTQARQSREATPATNPA